MMPATGAMSCRKLKLSLSYSVALMAFAGATRVAVGRRPHHRLGGEIGPGAGPAFDHDRLT
jgi:hypothetical protein